MLFFIEDERLELRILAWSSTTTPRCHGALKNSKTKMQFIRLSHSFRNCVQRHSAIGSEHAEGTYIQRRRRSKGVEGTYIQKAVRRHRIDGTFHLDADDYSEEDIDKCGVGREGVYAHCARAFCACARAFSRTRDCE